MSWIKSLRLKANRIKVEERLYIFEAIECMMKYRKVKGYKVYISGSHSKGARKYPNKYSDIDIYIVISNNDYKRLFGFYPGFGIHENNEMGEAIRCLVGLPIQVFMVDENYSAFVKENMEGLV